MKQVSYRGGLVTFRIPRHWVEEYEEGGGATFYEDRPDSGTLRLNVLTFSSTTEQPAPTPMAVLQRLSGEGREYVQALPDGGALLHGVKVGAEEGRTLHTHYWHIAQCVPPHDCRLAIFTYTVDADAEGEPLIRHELQLLHDELPQAVVSSVGAIADAMATQ